MLGIGGASVHHPGGAKFFGVGGVPTTSQVQARPSPPLSLDHATPRVARYNTGGEPDMGAIVGKTYRSGKKPSNHAGCRALAGGNGVRIR